MKPLVSIIIPSYNAGARLVPCIKSCLVQSYENLEIILVDNNSTDGSIEEASRLLEPNAIRSKIVRCTEQGSMPSRVMGFEHSEGEFIQLLDADDELLPEKIAVQMAQFEVSVGVDVIYGDWEWRFLRDDGSYSALHFKSDNYSDYLLRLLANEWRPPICFLTRRKVMAAVYPEYIKHKIKINEDRLSISLVAAVGAVFRYAPGAVSIYNNWSSGQETKNISQDEMAAANRDIFTAVAEHLDQSRIEMSAMHRTLLNLSWNLVELGEVDIEKDGETFFVRLEKGAERVELSAAEKNLIVALGGCQGGQTMEAYSYLLLRRLIRMIAPRGDEEFGRVMAKLSAVLGLASGVDGRGRDGCEGFESQVLANSNLKQLLAGPLYMPILTKERMRVVEIMGRLLSIGVLVESARGE
ncbi:hypothetical protein BOW53_05535 [Solemya pervernicosa gill symbiont]|uniref:Glycosyltransferase 2-like domain-containing protein n=2 Tax=Gammaproteobacteria incertae sedis TaxID=118884 RepID=A0A1T2L799_9GAMM|nr:glycosyltransferase family A protein [Candidatus Reidiella endopervernicosa]OOZ40988.1 hypothetical protein BOW53_05535 [Solemya pervernicosa gill symbiont]QKQ25041.1 glycosyltransferase family 2 protein [Candidatus Reidiella endopervernicosa]